MNNTDKRPPAARPGVSLRGASPVSGEAIGKRPAGMDERSDARLAQLIETGIEMGASQGRRAAESFLRKAQVPDHVVLRVLSCAAFRRKPVR